MTTLLIGLGVPLAAAGGMAITGCVLACAVVAVERAVKFFRH